MSFLLGRSQQQPRSYTAAGATATPHNGLLFDAGSDDGDNDDELEAAFGDSDARELDNARDYRRQLDETDSTTLQGQRGQQQQQSAASNGIQLNAYRPEGHSHVGEDSITMDDDSENDHLLRGGSSFSAGQRPEAGASSRSHSPRPRMATADTGLSHHTSSSSPGGYDFEADPYERRSAPISLGVDDDDDEDALPTSRRRRQGGASGRNGQLSSANGASAGLLGILRNILPSRFREYGILNTDSRTASGRRTDGTTDHGDDDDEDSDNWIAPPPSMPGIYGGGLANDGVFANMAAKPGSRTRGERSDIVGGDDEAPEKEIPPAYELAVLDAAPPYFDTTVHAPGLGGLGGVGGATGGLEEILIEGLPLGNPFSFFWSLLVSMSFQFVGFLLTTLLSTSHAAKNGSRAGLGVTLIQYGLYLGAQGEDVFSEPSADSAASGESGKDEWAAFWGVAAGGGDGADAEATPTGATARLLVRTVVNGVASLSENTTAQDPWRGPVLLDGGAAVSGVATSWLSMVLMIGGWFLLVSSLTSYLKAIRYAKALRDGVSTNPDSWLERGGPIGALYTRVTGREMPTFQQERTWGLAPRPAPRQAEPSTDSTNPPPVPSESTRPSGFLPSFINRGATGVRSI